MITVTSQSKNYAPEAVLKRYVRFDGETYLFCEVGIDRRYDLRQGTVTEDELPESIAAKARARKGFWPSYVEWPL